MAEQTTGQRLRAAREEKEISLGKAARETYIRLQVLEAIEADRLDQLPSPAQARGFIRAYAGYLGMDPAELDLVETPPTGHQPPHRRIGRKGLTHPDPAESASPSSSPDPDESEAQALYTAIGGTLKQRRDLLSLRLDEIETQTHLRSYYLDALEKGEIERLPSPMQGRGMLKNYAEFLGLDADALLLEYAEALQTTLADRQGRPTDFVPESSKPKRPSFIRSLISLDLLVGVGVFILMLVFVIWAAQRVNSTRAGQVPTLTAPSVVDMLLPSPSPTFSPTPATATPTLSPELAAQATELAESEPFSPTPEINIPFISEDPVQVQIIVRERAYLKVTVDGTIELDSRVLPGSAYNFSGRETVEVLTGSGSALQVIFNQQDLGPMGLFGEVINRIYTAQGVQAPTPTITHTPTITETPSDTPTPTETPTPTQTPQP